MIDEDFAIKAISGLQCIVKFKNGFSLPSSCQLPNFFSCRLGPGEAEACG